MPSTVMELPLTALITPCASGRVRTACVTVPCPDGQMIRLTFLQAVLDGVAAFIAHGIAAHAVVLPKPMRKPVFILGTDAAVALYA